MIKIGIFGLGYVGLPLAISFSKKFKVVGYDININRIKELNLKYDSTKEFSSRDLKRVKSIKYTNNIKDLSKCNVYIITVPTPINKKNKPDLRHLSSSCKSIGKIIKKGDIVILESTVYPGITEDYCAPIIESTSNLIFNKDFFCGYSPERINPGDKFHKIENIMKITSGSNTKTANFIDKLYRKIIKAGTYKVSSIKIAEAAKVIENTQRDLNIAFVNELSIIFNLMNLDTKEILDAASTKWNFQNFKPGLVGGHCIGVDPYYLTYKSQKIGYNPKIILSGRKINDNMSSYVVKQLIKSMKENNINIKNSKILIMGISFKENCSDIRNSKIIDIFHKLKKKRVEVDIFDPNVNYNSVLNEYQIEMVKSPKKNYYNAVIIAVAHKKFLKIGIKNIQKYCRKNHVIYDLKYLFSKSEVSLRL